MEDLFFGTLEPFPGGSGTINGQVIRGILWVLCKVFAVFQSGRLDDTGRWELAPRHVRAARAVRRRPRHHLAIIAAQLAVGAAWLPVIRLWLNRRV